MWNIKLFGAIWVMMIYFMVIGVHASGMCKNGSPTFNQEAMCSSVADGEFKPSWCSEHNPFAAVPYLFSDNKFPSWLNVEDGAICSTSNPQIFSYMNGTLIDGPKDHDNDEQYISPRDKCRFISKINTIEFSSSDDKNPQRYVVLGLVSGQIILMNFNNDATFLVGKTGDMTNIRTLETLTNGTDLYVSSVSYGNAVSLFYGSSNKIDSIKSCGNIVEINRDSQYAPDVRLIINEKQIYASVVVYNSAQQIYTIQFFKLSGCSYTKEFEYKINENWNSKLVFRVFSQLGGFDNTITTQSFKHVRTLLQFYTTKHVKIIEMTPQNIEMDLTTIDTSTFYVTKSNEEITSSAIAYEQIRRIDFEKSTCDNIIANQAQGSNLLVTLKRNGQHVLIARNLLEFANYAFFEDSGRIYSNPAGRFTECNTANGIFYDTKTNQCVPAFETEKIISGIGSGEEIQELRTRFHNVPTDYAQYLDRDLTEKQDISAMCYSLGQIPAFEETCLQQANQSTCNLDLFANSGQKFLPKLLSDFWVNQVFISKTGKEVLVYGLQQKMCSLDGLYLDTYNKISLLGESNFMDITRNSQHMFVTISRERWELQSINRFYSICKKLEKDPDDPFLKPFAQSCQANTPTPVTLNQFGQYTSSCFAGMACPSLKTVEINKVADGNYTTRPNAVKRCEKSHFCLQGIQQKCPPGFQCPNDGMSKPVACKFTEITQRNQVRGVWDKPKGSETCFSQGSTVPQPCLNGTICITPYFPPIPISPGLYLEGNSIKKCKVGDYCNLGRFIGKNENSSALQCPENTYCAEPVIMEPSLCIPNETAALYCPSGTTTRRLCSRGFYCPKPSVQLACKYSQFCDEGSFVPSPCPAGFFCPSPSNKVICPAGYYCVVGSVYPTACPTFSICPEGTKAYEDYALGVIIDILIAGVVILTYKMYTWTKVCWNKFQEKRRNKKKEERAHQVLSTSFEMDSPSEFAQYIPKLTVSEVMEGLYKDVRVEIAFENLSLDLKTNNKRILHNLNGKFRAGRLTCIMGPSGSGKTTLLSAISGKAPYANVVGDIKINGVKSSMKKFKNVCAFVQQEDCMHRELTVEECIYFSARTRLNTKVSQKTIDSIVDGVIQILDLNHVRHSIIGDETKRGVSGGQRKRVSIAMELVACPYVLFLDEPTSSLDAYSSFEVSKAMKDIASSGITVVAVLHQPRFEIFEMFDDVVLLGNGGRIVYMGPSADALQYFSEKLQLEPPPHVNPSDFFLDAIYDPQFTYQNQNKRTGKYVKPLTCKEMFDLWEENSNHIQSQTPKDLNLSYEALRKEEKSRGQNPLIHLYMCIRRSFILKIRDIMGFFVDSLLVYVAGLALGMIFLKDAYVGPLPKDLIDSCPSAITKICEYPLNNPIINVASTIPLALGLCAGMSSLGTFGTRAEQVIFKKEQSAGLSVMSYFLSKMLEQLPNIVFGPIIFLSIFFSLYSPRATFWEYYLILFLMHFTTFGLGSFISVYVKLDLIQLATAVLILISQLVGGSKPTLPQMKEIMPPLFWISCLSYVRYAQEALYLIELRNYKDIFDIRSSLEVFDYNLGNLDFCIGMIPVFGVCFRILTLIALYQKNDDSLWNTILMYFSYYSNIDNLKSSAKSVIKKFKKSKPKTARDELLLSTNNDVVVQ